MRKLVIAPLCTALLLTLGCSDDDAGTPAPDAGTPELPSVRIAIENTGELPVWIQEVGDAETPAWYAIKNVDGEDVVDESTCMTCSCGNPGCQTCEAPARRVRIINPGESVERVWIGTAYVRDFEDSNGQPCDRIEAIDPEQEVSFDIQLCWGSGISSGEDGAADLAGATCETRTVDFDESLSAVVTVSPAAPTVASTRFVMENRRSRSIWIQETSDCTNLLAWSFVSSGGEPVDAYGPCGMCECAAGPACVSGCPGECLPTAAREIPAGGDVSWTWDGTKRLQYSEDEWQCQVRVDGPTDSLTVDLCYGTAVDADGTVTGVFCSQQAFSRGQEMVLFQVL